MSGMEEPSHIPKLMELLFGEAAPAAQRLASSRLLLWCEAFEEWLDWRGLPSSRGAYYISKHTWRRLLQERRKMPWELTQADIEAHAAWMLDREYAASKINESLGIIANFYRWCSQHQIDPECPPDYNPAAEAPRLKVRKYARTVLLSRQEVDSLLGFMRQDETPLGRRDYALILSRLRLGASLKNLLQLQWGQIEQDAEGIWVHWPSGTRARLPGDTWEAIQTALAAAGRLPGMLPESYVFAPLGETLQVGEHDGPEAWVEGRPLTSGTVLFSLKRYGRRLGLREEKLSLRALHRTATRLRLDEGYTLKEMKVFLDSREDRTLTRFRLKFLPQLPPDLPGEGEHSQPPLPALPSRSVRLFQPEDKRTHGMFARSRPPEAVRAVLAEDIYGIDEELAGLRSLARSLLDPRAAYRKPGDTVQFTAAYTQAASRLALMMEAQKKLPAEDETWEDADDWPEDDQFGLERAAEDDGDDEEAAASATPDGEAMGISDRSLREEIAATRYALRNTLALASAELKASAYIRLVEVYGDGCVRLVRLLKSEQSEQERLRANMPDPLEQTNRELDEMWERVRAGETVPELEDVVRLMDEARRLPNWKGPPGDEMRTD